MHRRVCAVCVCWLCCLHFVCQCSLFAGPVDVGMGCPLPDVTFAKPLHSQPPNQRCFSVSCQLSADIYYHSPNVLYTELHEGRLQFMECGLHFKAF